MTAPRINTLPLMQLRTLFPPLLLISLVTNLTVLVSPLFMMQVLDRVVPSGNLNTLVLLLLIAWAVLAANAVLEYYRDTTLSRSANWFDQTSTDIVLNSGAPDRLERVLDIRVVAEFLTGSGASTVMNLPWVVLFLGALYLLHPAFLLLALFASGMILAMKKLGSVLSRQADLSARQAQSTGNALIGDLQNHQRLAGMMSIGQNLIRRHGLVQETKSRADNEGRTIKLATGSIAGFLRSGAQIGALATGAALVTRAELSAGGMIGAAIIMAKTIGTIESFANSAENLRRTSTSFKNLLKFEPAQAQLSTDIGDR